MLTLENKILDISKIESLATNFSKKIKVGDVLLLKGELGVGKTTFSRFIINNLFDLNNLSKPEIVNSPTFPILLTYNLGNHEIYHYDFYRVNNIKDLKELDFFENLNNSITLVEWPEILIDLPFNKRHYLVNLHLHSTSERVINIKYFE